MERRIIEFLLFLSMLICLSFLLLSCSDELGLTIDDDNRAYLEGPEEEVPVLELPEISPPNDATITAHEIITVMFPAAMNTETLSVGGDFDGAPVNWETTNFENDTLVLNELAIFSWQDGENKSLVITIEGYDEPISFLFDVFKGVCVSDPGNAENPGSSNGNGTRLNPLDTIQSGINKAKELYIATSNGPAVVRVAQGTYSVTCAVSPTPLYVVNMTAGVSLEGGYALNFASRNPAENTSNIIDSSTDAAGSSTSNPVRAVNGDGSAITEATRIDGFTITPGRQGADGNVHCGIALVNGASPTIYNISITGRGIAERSFTTYGIFLSSSSAVIQKCTINPTATDYSYAVYTINGASTPTIKESTINGGEADYTVGIRLRADVNATITNNEINGGNWTTTLPGAGYGIDLRNCSPTITDNHFTIHTAFHDETYGIHESNDASDPVSVRRNDFDYDGNWYKDESAGPVITSANYNTSTISTGEGTDYLFNLTWENYSTEMSLP